MSNVGNEFEDPITLVLPNAGKNNAEVSCAINKLVVKRKRK